MKRTRIAALLLVLVLALASTFVCVGCGKDKKKADKHPADNSFAGAMSTESYESEDDAAAAFVENEINGKATDATFVSYKKEKDLTKSEIEALVLGGDYSASEVVSAESGKVTFTEDNLESRAARSSSSSGNKTSRIFIIKIGNVYFYYTPVFKKGETLTKSYISEILDYNKYTNSTIISTSKATAQGVSATTTITVKYAENGVYSKTEIKSIGVYSVTELILVPYTNEYGTTLLGYTRQGTSENEDEMSSWSSTYLGYSSIEGFLKASFNIDHSYFERADWGFKMSKDKMNQYMNDTLGDFMSAYGGEIKSGDAKYYVADGKLSTSEAKMTLATNYGTFTVTATGKYTNFGSTVVEIPEEISAKLAA